MRAGNPARAAIAALLVASLVGGVGADERPAATAPVVPPPQRSIDEAVARGVAWLRKEQSADGSFGAQPGQTALSLLALRHSAVPPDDRTCLRAAASLERELPDDTTYAASLGIVALLEQEPRRHREKVASLVADLVRAQCENGQWSYSTGRGSRGTAGDNSNTQLAAFGLAAARAAGIPVPKESFARCREFLRTTRNDDGGWGYSTKERTRSYAAMTAGCAASFALSGDEPPGDARIARQPEVAAALNWLGERFEPGVNSGAAAAFGSKKGRRGDDVWRHYWLWSLERTCSVAGVREIGGHDWYAEGARYLLDAQRDDGSWVGPEAGGVATPFALLFFARASLRVVTPRTAPATAVTPR